MLLPGILWLESWGLAMGAEESVDCLQPSKITNISTVRNIIDAEIEMQIKVLLCMRKSDASLMTRLLT